MSSVKERQRNNVRVGVFVTLALILAISILIALTDIAGALMQDTKSYTVSFNVASGVSNLKPGSEVRVGGLAMGSVSSVEPDVDTEPFETILVGIELESKVTLYDNAMILLTKSLLGAEAWLDCPSVGDPSTGTPLAEGGIVNATEAPGMLTTLLGAENASKTGLIVSDFQETMSSAKTLTLNFEQEAGPILEDVKAISSETRELVQGVRNENWPRWASRIDNLMEWAGTATGTIDTTLEEGRLLLADTHTIVTENSDGIGSIVANTESFTERLNTELADKASALLDHGREGLDGAMAMLERFQEDYETWSVDIGESMGNATIASQQLKLAMIEIRRSPWKVLYRPTEKELENELLYEATRSFAVAAADIKAASLSVNRILDGYGDQIAKDQDLQERLTRALLDPLDRYEKAQQQLFDVLVMETK